MPEPELWLSGDRGQYIPRDFAQSFKDRDTAVTGVSAEDWTILEAGPDHADYWDAWDEVFNNARVTLDGTEYFLHQDGDLCDLWLVPEGMVWSDKGNRWVWPDDDDADDADEEDEAEDE
jgi:hypothetical protein